MDSGWFFHEFPGFFRVFVVFHVFYMVFHGFRRGLDEFGWVWLRLVKVSGEESRLRKAPVVPKEGLLPVTSLVRVRDTPFGEGSDTYA